MPARRERNHVFIVIGVGIILLHFLGFGPMANWTWNLSGDLWKFAVPFGAGRGLVVWADGTGLTKRREMEKMDERKRERREKNLVSLGMDKMAKRARKAGKRIHFGSNLSSTAPELALEAFIANFASTPRV